MNIKITIEVTGDNLTVTTGQDTGDEPGDLPQVPQGTDAFIEHADHDSTPRLLGFTAQPAQHDN